MAAKDEFFERSKEIINLCNEQYKGTPRDIDIAASAAHGAARYSVWAVARSSLSARELEARKAQAIDTFTKGYREFLEEHFKDYIDNYGTYFAGQMPAVSRPASPK